VTAALLLAAAALLVAFGGLMAAVDAALGVTSRSDLEEMSQAGRNAAFLRGIADDPAAHANAAGFMRVLSETTAAVLVTVAVRRTSVPAAGDVELAARTVAVAAGDAVRALELLSREGETAQLIGHVAAGEGVAHAALD